MSGKTVRAEWALQGKTAGDTGYRLLSCSDGVVSPENFEEVLSRYSPGTLEDLPQVTISWLSDRHEQNYLAIAIHDVAEGGLYDARGREIVFTSYFCVPYEELAADAISYSAMYAGFRGVPLRPNDRSRVTAELAVPLAAGPATAAADDQVFRVAALLLTNKPVCVLAADGASLEERLLFLDSVMSLLPYGMRSRLSASTWTSSTYQGHKFRLFFAGAPREADDHVVVWGQHDPSPIGHRYADDYLSWLRSQAQWPVVRLAAQTERRDFSPKHVLTMLELLGVAAFGSAAKGPGTDLARVMTPRELIVSCAGRLASANPKLISTEIRLLRGYVDKPTAPAERAKLWELIFEHRLLREDLPIGRSVKTEFYAVLLQLAFGGEVTYADYCAVEDCVGHRDRQQLHSTLLQAISQVGFAEFSAQLLVMNGLDARDLRDRLRSGWVGPDKLVEVAALRRLRPHHARTICDLSVRALRERSGGLDRQALREVLHRHDYLAPVLQQRHHDEPEYQLTVMRELLQAAYGSGLDSSAVAEITGNLGFAPTPALLATTIILADPADAGLVVWEHSRNLLFNTRFDHPTDKQLKNLLPAYDELEGEPATAGLPRIPQSISPRGSGWLARATGWRGPNR